MTELEKYEHLKSDSNTGKPEQFEGLRTIDKPKGVPFKPDCVTCKNMVDNEGVAACDIGGCNKPPEQPNQSAILVKTIQSLAICINNELEKLREGITDQIPGDSCRKMRVLQALEEIDLFERTTLFELQKAFE